MSQEPILEVNAITRIVFDKKNPPNIHIDAKGLVSSLGWSNGLLIPRVYVKPPADGIQDFDFVATRPTGPVPLPLATICGSGGIEMAPWMCGVRVHAKNNAVEQKFASSCDPLFECELPVDENDSRKTPLQTEDEADHEVETAEVYLDFGGDQKIEGANRCHSFDLLTISNFPEAKTEWENKCILRIGGKCRASTKIPILYRRTSRLVLSVRICWPSEDDIVSAVVDCARQAVAAGVLAGLISGSLQAAAAALKAYLIACLKSKGIGFADDISVSLQQLKREGTWKRV